MEPGSRQRRGIVRRKAILDAAVELLVVNGMAAVTHRAVADAAERVQPVSVGYDRLGGLPACRRDRSVFAWYGDMDIGRHAWRLARHPGLRATVVLHEAIAPSAIPDRKALSAAV